MGHAGVSMTRQYAQQLDGELLEANRKHGLDGWL